MAQMNSVKILAGFDALSSEDQDILNIEMSRTGCMGQSFSSHLTPPDVQSRPMGPALLVYYGPAFLQGLGNDSPSQRLALLAEIYRGARELWPLQIAHVSTSVI